MLPSKKCNNVVKAPSSEELFTERIMKKLKKANPQLSLKNSQVKIISKNSAPSTSQVKITKYTIFKSKNSIHEVLKTSQSKSRGASSSFQTNNSKDHELVDLVDDDDEDLHIDKENREPAPDDDNNPNINVLASRGTPGTRDETRDGVSSSSSLQIMSVSSSSVDVQSLRGGSSSCLGIMSLGSSTSSSIEDHNNDESYFETGRIHEDNHGASGLDIDGHGDVDDGGADDVSRREGVHVSVLRDDDDVSIESTLADHDNNNSRIDQELFVPVEKLFKSSNQLLNMLKNEPIGNLQFGPGLTLVGVSHSLVKKLFGEQFLMSLFDEDVQEKVDSTNVLESAQELINEEEMLEVISVSDSHKKKVKTLQIPDSLPELTQARDCQEPEVSNNINIDPESLSLDDPAIFTVERMSSVCETRDDLPHVPNHLPELNNDDEVLEDQDNSASDDQRVKNLQILDSLPELIQEYDCQEPPASLTGDSLSSLEDYSQERDDGGQSSEPVDTTESKSQGSGVSQGLKDVVNGNVFESQSSSTDSRNMIEKSFDTNADNLDESFASISDLLKSDNEGDDVAEEGYTGVHTVGVKEDNAFGQLEEEEDEESEGDNVAKENFLSFFGLVTHARAAEIR